MRVVKPYSNDSSRKGKYIQDTDSISSLLGFQPRICCLLESISRGSFVACSHGG